MGHGECFDKLVKIRRNWAKSPNRVHSSCWLERKEAEVRQLLKECEGRESSLLDKLVNLSAREVCRNTAKELLALFAKHREVYYPDKDSSRLSVETGESSDSEDDITMAQPIPFRDVEQSLPRYSGGPGVAKWLQSFGESAVIYEWSALQQFIYCRQLLRDAAKLAVENRATINSFDTLKAFLLEEFETEENSAALHDQLGKMRKMGNESSTMFGYRVQAVASRGTVDDRSVLTYIVRGLGLPCAVKANMLAARSWKDLKTLLVAFDEANIDEKRSQNNRSFKNLNPNTPSFTPAGGGAAPTKTGLSTRVKQEVFKCYNCDATDHMARNCPQPVKCYKCKGVGHRASGCPTGNQA